MRKLVIAASVAVVLCAACAARPKVIRRLGADPNRESIVAEINAVTVLHFETDRPITEFRLLLDGKQDMKGEVRTSAKGLLLAIVPQVATVDIHCKVGDSNQVITVNLRANVRADVGDRKYYGPGKKIALNGWTRVFGITRGDMKGRIHRTLALEVK